MSTPDVLPLFVLSAGDAVSVQSVQVLGCMTLFLSRWRCPSCHIAGSIAQQRGSHVTLIRGHVGLPVYRISSRTTRRRSCLSPDPITCLSNASKLFEQNLPGSGLSPSAICPTRCPLNLSQGRDVIFLLRGPGRDRRHQRFDASQQGWKVGVRRTSGNRHGLP